MAWAAGGLLLAASSSVVRSLQTVGNCNTWASAARSHVAALVSCTSPSAARSGNAAAASTIPAALLRAFRQHSSKASPSVIRDFAIIAHIDHGKTTLMDRLLAQCGQAVQEDRAMDSNTLEKERGITILAKVTSFTYKGAVLNAVDTPGHADFGGEVERVLSMVDGAVLLVDATEGPLAQTKFVLEKALKKGIKPIVVLNKVDRESATPERCAQVETQLFDLFAALGANDEQLDFMDGRLLYASAKQGWATTELPPGGQAPPGASMAPLLDAILREVPPPGADANAPFSMLVSMIERDSYLGRIATGRVASGVVRVGDKVRVLRPTIGDATHSASSSATASPAGPEARAAAAAAAGAGAGAQGVGAEGEDCRVTRIFKRVGMHRAQVDEAVAGDIVSIAGCPAGITDTIAGPECNQALDPGHIDPPTLSMVFGPNDSPLAGRAGKAVTGRVIGERLLAEAETSVSLRVAPLPGGVERYEVQARGELQLGVLIENMRREGMELAVSPPRVLLRKDESGRVQEPVEEVMCEVSSEVAGAVIEALSVRKGELRELINLPGDKQRLEFVVPSRGMIGFKTTFVHLTRGEGLMARSFLQYDAYRGPLQGVRKGSLIAMSDGRSTTYALGELQSRGTFFIEPGADVYSGMIIGENNRDEDMEVNPCKEKKLTNVRSVQADEKVSLSAPRLLSLEEAIGYVSGSELVEVTPTAVRVRKEVLDATQRKVQAKKEASY